MKDYYRVLDEAKLTQTTLEAELEEARLTELKHVHRGTLEGSIKSLVKKKESLEDALRESTAALGRLYQAHQEEKASLIKRLEDAERCKRALKFLTSAYGPDGPHHLSAALRPSNEPGWVVAENEHALFSDADEDFDLVVEELDSLGECKGGRQVLDWVSESTPSSRAVRIYVKPKEPQ